MAGPTLSVTERVHQVETRISEACRRSGRNRAEVTLVAISKGFPPAAIREAQDAGMRNFGENRIQEAQDKLPSLADLRERLTWHMVGHLQSNKIKTALNLFDIIQSVDSLNLAEAISRRASAPVPIFLEVNIAGEASKFGFSPDDLSGTLAKARQLPNLDIRGLMTVAPAVHDSEEVRPVFSLLRRLAGRSGLSEVSMGMTDDFEVAIEEGATQVRIGRAIFGERPA